MQNMILLWIDPQIRWVRYIPLNDIKNFQFYFLNNFTPSPTWFTTLQNLYFATYFLNNLLKQYMYI